MSSAIKRKPGRPPLTDRSPSKRDILIGSLLRHRRQELDLSQTELGRGSGVTFQQIQKYESGVNRISAGRLEEFAATLGVSILYFFPDHHQPLPTPVDHGVRRLADECSELPADTLKHLLALVRSFKAHGMAR